MGSIACTTSSVITVGAELIGVVPVWCGLVEVARGLFLADDGTFKWVLIDADVFPGKEWSYITMEEIRSLTFPLFPSGSWNFGRISRLEDDKVDFTTTLSRPIEGIDNTWHPTKIDFMEFELVSEFPGCTDARLWHAKHPLFNDKPLFVKISPWATGWARITLEKETKAYEKLQGLGMSPHFLGHVTYQGAVIGLILEWIDGAKTTDKKDKGARIKLVKKLHRLGIAHGCAHHKNFLKAGDNMMVIDFEEARFDDEATDEHKKEDIRRVRDFKNDMSWQGIVDEWEDIPPSEPYWAELSNHVVLKTKDSTTSGKD